MSACDCSFVQMGLHCVTRGQVRVVVHCLTATKGSEEIRVVGGKLRKLRIQMSRWEFRVNKHDFRIAPFPTDYITSRQLPLLPHSGIPLAGLLRRRLRRLTPSSTLSVAACCSP